MTISTLPFIRLIALTSITLVVAGLVLGITGHQQSKQLGAGAPGQDTVAVGGLTYQSPESRALDPHNPVDREILRGIPAVRQQLPRGEELFGVFVSVYNPGRRVRPAARRFVLADLDGHRFRPEPLGDDAYAYRPGTVAPGRRYPTDASAAARNLTTQGALLLFRIPRASSDYGPLALRIVDPTHHQPPADLKVS